MGGISKASQPVVDDNGANDSDDEGGIIWKALEENQRSKPYKVSEKKREDAAIFNSYLESQWEGSSVSSKAPVQFEDRSVEWLMHKIEARKIIESPRDYQIELFERAKGKNTIAVLDTG